MKPTGPRSEKEIEAANAKLARTRHSEISAAVPKGKNQWSAYEPAQAPPRRKAG